MQRIFEPDWCHGQTHYSKESRVHVVCSLRSSISEIEARLPRARLLVLCRNEAVLKWMSTCDHLMYQALVEILIPDVLRPIPSETPHVYLANMLGGFLWLLTYRVGFVLFLFLGALTQAIRNFAKSLEGWLNNAMNAIPQRMIQTKVHYCSSNIWEVHEGGLFGAHSTYMWAFSVIIRYTACFTDEMSLPKDANTYVFLVTDCRC